MNPNIIIPAHKFELMEIESLYEYANSFVGDESPTLAPGKNHVHIFLKHITRSLYVSYNLLLSTRCYWCCD